MPKQLHVWPESWKRENDELIISAVIESPEADRQTFWYRIPTAWESAVTDRADPLAIATIFTAMQKGADVVIHGEVSPSLLRNLEEFEDIWHCWKPERYQKVELKADCEKEAVPASGDEAISCFSGGVDGCFTAYRNKKGLAGRHNRNLTACLMVHGFDIPLNKPETFVRAASSASNVLESIELPLIGVASNWRMLGIDWGDGHGVAMAACLSLFSKRFAFGLIGSGGASSYDFQGPWGSTPFSDPLLSSDSFRIISDGAAYDRTAKVAMISNWDAAVKNLRVCWQGKEQDRNCGKCEKCIRTIMNFRLIGRPLPPCFEADVSDAQLRRIHIHSISEFSDWKSILKHARARNLQDTTWFKGLEQRVKRGMDVPGRKSLKNIIRGNVGKVLRRLGILRR